MRALATCVAAVGLAMGLSALPPLGTVDPSCTKVEAGIKASYPPRIVTPRINVCEPRRS